MEDKADIIDAFSKMAPRYEQIVDSELNRFWGWSYQGFVNLILATTPIQPKDIVLDVATGTGVIPYHLEKAGHPHTQIHGLDITLSMIHHATRRMAGLDCHVKQNLVCASALEMPYAKSGFTQVICGLATHHMDVGKLVLECQRVLRSGGKLTIADVGGSDLWKVPFTKFLVQMAAFLYFLLFENKSRAWVEARAVSNIHSRDEWNSILLNAGFRGIAIQELKSRFFWIPAPLLIKAENSKMEQKYE